jgi:segregation and condensation protein B
MSQNMDSDTVNPSWPGLRWADLRRNVEALVFAAGDPLSVDKIMDAMELQDEPARRAIEQILEELAREFPVGGERGFELVELAGGWALRTSASASEAVAALFELPMEVGKLSPAAVECLAIVAYLQPVTRPQITEIRGVNSDSPVRTLLDRELIADVGRAETAGAATLYGTTKRFEVMFGLAGLEDLPPLDQFSLSEERKADLRHRLGVLTVPE